MTHSTIDNNDGRQDTHTGCGTTHDTNKTIFQVPNTLEADTIPVIGSSCMPLDIIDNQENGSTSSAVHHHASAPVDYYPGRIGPPTIPDYKINQGDFNEVSVSFKRDIAWSIAGSFVGEDLKLSGSWTPFNKTVSSYDTVSCNELYLPVTHPPEYPIFKDYLDFLVEVIDELEISHIFVRSHIFKTMRYLMER